MEVCWLIKNGIPMERAFSLPEDERIAYAVTFSAFEGAIFDWNTLRYKERKP